MSGGASGVPWVYALAPVVAWLVAGGAKFIVNSLRSRRWAVAQIGMGGTPSTHTTIVIATLTLLVLREGVSAPVVPVAATVALIVIIDAADLRRKVGLQASQLKRLFPGDAQCQRLRTSIGHSLSEIAAGIFVGAACGFLLFEAVPN